MSNFPKKPAKQNGCSSAQQQQSFSSQNVESDPFQRLIELSEINNTLQIQVQDLKDRIALCQEKYQEESQNLAKDLDLARKERRNDLEHYNTRVNQLEAQLDEKDVMINEIEQKKQGFQSEISSFLAYMSGKLDQPFNNLNDAIIAFNKLTASNNDLQQQNFQLHMENETIKQQLREASKKPSTSSKGKSKATNKIQKIQNHPTHPNESQVIPQLLESLQAAEDANKKLKEENASLKVLSTKQPFFDSGIAIESQMFSAKDPTQNFNNCSNPKMEDTNESQLECQAKNIDQNPMESYNQHILQEKGEMKTKSQQSLALQLQRVIGERDVLRAKYESLEKEFNKTLQQVDNQNQKLEENDNERQEVEEALTEAAARLDDLQKQLTEKDETISSLKTELKSTKKAYQQISQEHANTEAELVSTKTQARELQLRVSDVESVLQQVEAQKRRSNSKDNEICLAEKIAQFTEASQQFEAVFDQQSDEIATLSSERTKLIAQFEQMDAALIEVIKRNEVLETDNEQLSSRLEQFSTTVDQTQQLQKQLYERAIDETIDISPADLFDELSDLKAVPPHEAIPKVAELLVEHQVQHQVISDEDKSKIDSLNKQNSALIAHLQNSLKFIKEQAGGTSDPMNRNVLLTQCARLGKYIEDEKIKLPLEEFESRPSLFDPAELNDPHKVAQVMLDFISEEEMSEHPHLEMFTLLSCIVQIASMLIDQTQVDSQRLHDDEIALSNAEDEHNQLTALKERGELLNEIFAELDDFFIQYIGNSSYSSANSSPASKSYSSASRSHNSQSSENLQKLQNSRGSVQNSQHSKFSQKSESFNSESSKVSENVENLEIEKFTERAHRFMEMISQNKVGIVERDEFEARERELEEQLKELHQELSNATDDQEETKQEFCKRAGKMVEALQAQMEDEALEHQATSAEIAEKLEDTKKELRNQKKASQEKIKNLEIKVGKRDKAIKDLHRENEAKSRKMEELKIELRNLQKHSEEQIETLVSELESYKGECHSLSQSVESLEISRRELKKKVEEAQGRNKELLEEIKERTEELALKYEDKIGKLEQEVKSTEEEARKYKEEVEGFSAMKQKLMEENARLKVGERSLGEQLKRAKEQILRERQAGEGKVRSVGTALKSEYEMRMKEIGDELSRCMEAICMELEEVYDAKIEESMSACELVGILEEEIEKQQKMREEKRESLEMVREAAKARKLLGIGNVIGKEEKLSEAVKRVIKEKEEAEKRAEEAEKESGMARYEEGKVRGEKEKQEKREKEGKEWMRWGTSLYREVRERRERGISGEEMRKELEEIVFGDMMREWKERETKRKLEILRAEKKILEKGEGKMKKQSWKNKNTMRTLMIVIVFGRRLEEMGGLRGRGRRIGAITKDEKGYVGGSAKKPLVPIE